MVANKPSKTKEFSKNLILTTSLLLNSRSKNNNLSNSYSNNSNYNNNTITSNNFKIQLIVHNPQRVLLQILQTKVHLLKRASYYHKILDIKL